MAALENRKLDTDEILCQKIGTFDKNKSGIYNPIHAKRQHWRTYTCKLSSCLKEVRVPS